MHKLFVVTTLLALSAACVGSPGEGKPRAEVEQVPAAEAAVKPAEAAPAEGAPAEQAAAEMPVPPVQAATVLQVDRAASKLGAIGAKISAKHPIDFKDFEGRIGLDGDTVTAVSFAAGIATLESDHPKLTAHLRDADFLDAAQFPHATFASTEVVAQPGDDGATHVVKGDLAIHGKTLRVTFPATISVAADKVEAKTEFVINRQDFDVRYPGRPDDLVQDDVLLQVAFVAGR